MLKDFSHFRNQSFAFFLTQLWLYTVSVKRFSQSCFTSKVNAGFSKFTFLRITVIAFFLQIWASNCHWWILLPIYFMIFFLQNCMRCIFCVWTMFVHYINHFILQSCVSSVGLGGSILFRQLLSFPVYATVSLSSIGLQGGGKVIASQHGFEFQRLSQWPSG